MLHTKFQGHRPFGSGEEDFLRFLLYMRVWMGGGGGGLEFSNSKNLAHYSLSLKFLLIL